MLITEQQVVFGTAAAASLPRVEKTHGVFAAVRALLWASSERTRPTEGLVAPRHYPRRREAFIEDAAMAREMFRL
ncbi:hypothetical protein ABGB19_07545 [Mycobacterium sp. B14F4]|uniref:hypothetical protein n=1 Tax=Mycobacterium sp. B14F4 TaxID=3153565 RepID=UPI00325EFED7